MGDEPDLFAEFDAAEAIVTGRAEAVVTEWGMRHDDCLTDVHDYGRDEGAARQSVADHARLNGRLVRRTVTYGEWEEVPGVD
jgi:hypothetical protein